MKIVIPGGTGQVGTLLARAFLAAGHDIVVFSRNAHEAAWRTAVWDGADSSQLVGEVDGADVVINLAGRSVNCRYGVSNRKAILDSRVNSTQAVGEAIAAARKPPRVWLQMSTATIYAHRYDAANDETHGILDGHDLNMPDTWKFSAHVATSWENKAREYQTSGTRQVLLRSAIVLSPDSGGIFDVLLRLVRFGLGGRAGDGRQFVSWIHEADFVGAVQHVIERESFRGPVNLAAPNPLPNAEFMRALRQAWGAKLGLPAAEWMIEAGAFLLRTESELVLKSRRVVPGRLLEDGFRFSFPVWPEAASDLCDRWRKGF